MVKIGGEIILGGFKLQKQVKSVNNCKSFHPRLGFLISHSGPAVFSASRHLLYVSSDLSGLANMQHYQM